jgi:hypothetical protein
MAWNPGSGWAGPVTTSGVTEEEPSGGRRLAGRARLRRRARTEQGTFQPDNPATPDVNEAFEEEPEAQPEAEVDPGKLKQSG